MSVYVDESRFPFRGQRYCHMTADTHDELEEMARKVGLKPEWIQKPGTTREHYDMNPAKRRKAVAFGAIELTWREMGEWWSNRKAAA